MNMLRECLQLEIDNTRLQPVRMLSWATCGILDPSSITAAAHGTHTYRLPYSSSGQREEGSSLVIDMSPGSLLKITAGPARKGPHLDAVAFSLGTDIFGDYKA